MSLSRGEGTIKTCISLLQMVPGDKLIIGDGMEGPCLQHLSWQGKSAFMLPLA